MDPGGGGGGMGMGMGMLGGGGGGVAVGGGEDGPGFEEYMQSVYDELRQELMASSPPLFLGRAGGWAGERNLPNCTFGCTGMVFSKQLETQRSLRAKKPNL